MGGPPAGIPLTILVTGGGGFLGGAIVEQLLEREVLVRSFARSANPDLLARGVEVLQGDIADPDAVSSAVEGAEAVIHVAAKAGFWGSVEEYYRPNVIGTANVIAACRAYGVDRLVYTSTPSVVHAGGDVAGIDESAPYPDSYTSPYPATKAEAERLVLAANGDDLGTVAIRPHLIWGPGDNQLVPRLIERARQGRLRLVGDGANLIDTTFIDNAAHAHVLALDRLAPGSAIAGRAFFIAQGEPKPMKETLNLLLAAAGAPTVDKHISAPTATRLGAVAERVWRVGRLTGEPPLTRFLAEQLATAHWYDLSNAARDLDYTPVVTFDEGLARLAAFYRGSGGERLSDRI